MGAAGRRLVVSHTDDDGERGGAWGRPLAFPRNPTHQGAHSRLQKAMTFHISAVSVTSTVNNSTNVLAYTSRARLTAPSPRARMPLTNERSMTSTGNSTRRAERPASREQCKLDQQASAEPTLESPPKPDRKTKNENVTRCIFTFYALRFTYQDKAGRLSPP